MLKKKSETQAHDNKSLKKVALFCLLVFVLVSISFIAKVVMLMRESTFDGEERYTISIKAASDKLRIISADPQNETITDLQVTGITTKDTPQQLLGIPIDGNITVQKDLDISEPPSKMLYTLLTHPTSISKNITAIDLLRLMWLANSVQGPDINSEDLHLPISASEMNEKNSRLFQDSRIVDESVTIEINNGTDISGLGRRLERIIKNSGGNVIAVSSSSKDEPVSKIYYHGEESYTVRKIASILSFPTEQLEGKGIADIKIVIGADSVKAGKF